MKVDSISFALITRIWHNRQWRGSDSRRNAPWGNSVRLIRSGVERPEMAYGEFYHQWNQVQLCNAEPRLLVASVLRPNVHESHLATNETRVEMPNLRPQHLQLSSGKHRKFSGQAFEAGSGVANVPNCTFRPVLWRSLQTFPEMQEEPLDRSRR